MLLRAYKFDKYQTSSDDEDDGKASKPGKPLSVTIQCADAPGARGLQVGRGYCGRRRSSPATL
ncbi:MAG: hypothetical protein R3D43_12465 [Tepidamorphaceae bacterium]